MSSGARLLKSMPAKGIPRASSGMDYHNNQVRTKLLLLIDASMNGNEWQKLIKCPWPWRGDQSTATTIRNGSHGQWEKKKIPSWPGCVKIPAVCEWRPARLPCMEALSVGVRFSISSSISKMCFMRMAWVSESSLGSDSLRSDWVFTEMLII